MRSWGASRSRKSLHSSASGLNFQCTSQRAMHSPKARATEAHRASRHDYFSRESQSTLEPGFEGEASCADVLALAWNSSTRYA